MQPRRTVLSILILALVGATSGAALAGRAREADWKAIRRAVKGLPCEATTVTETETSENLKLLAQVPWGSDVTTGELDLLGDLLVAHIYDFDGGLITVEVADPLRPQILGALRLGPERFAYDVKLTEDGTTALVGFDQEAAGIVILNAGIALIDVRNPSKPRLMGEWVSPRPGPLQNGHMLYTANIDGTDWVFMAPNESTGVWIFRLEGPPGKKTLEFVTETLPVEGGVIGPHDMWVDYDETLETWILYVADGWNGWLAFDIDDPASPVPMGGFGPSTGYTHTIQSADIDGRRILATVEEVGINYLKVYDATNIEAPVLLGVWSTEIGPQNAQHNFQIVDGYLYMAHYDQGIFLFDLHNLPAAPVPDPLSLQPVGHYLPSGTAYWDVVMQDGLLYFGSFQAGGGVHVVSYGCALPGDESLTSTG